MRQSNLSVIIRNRLVPVNRPAYNGCTTHRDCRSGEPPLPNDMIQHWLRVTVLLAFVSATAGCGLFEPPPVTKRTVRAGRPPQTGTNIPRQTSDSAQQAKRDKKAKPAKPTPTPKPKRERAKPAEKVDEDFVTRGGFR